MKKKIAFIDHEYHIKTKSGEFLREMLKNNFIIKNFWVGKKNKFKVPKEASYSQNFFFFQIFPDLKFLEKNKGKNITWVPMYDSPHYPMGYSNLLWDIVEYYNIKIISFSRNILIQLKKRKIKSIHLQFYKPTNIVHKKKNEKLNIFFWYRNDLKLKYYLNYFNFSDIKKITYLTLDNLKPEEINYKNLNISYQRKKFLNQNVFKSYLKNNDIFLCARKKEGIGMAQVEAFSFGNYLVGYDDATMNEYISNSKIGFIVKKNSRYKISLLKVKKYFKYRLKINTSKHKDYQKKIYLINKLVNLPQPPFEKKILRGLYLKILFSFKLVLRKLIILLN